MKSITRTIAAATLSAGCLLGLSAVSAEARTVVGNIAGFQGVTAVDRYDFDSLYVPFPGHTGEVHVKCSTGDYNYRGMTRGAAHAIATTWCF